MSNKEQDRVWEHSKQKGADLVVMLALANRANDSGICWPSQDELAARARVNRRTAQRIVDRLIASGEIAVLDRPGKSYIYAILVGVSEDEKRRRIELAKTKQNVTGDKMSRVTNRHPKHAKLPPPGAQIPVQIGQPVVHSRAQNCTRTTIEPSVEPPLSSGSVPVLQENIFTVYENCIGLISPFVKERLEDLAKDYTDDWVMLATKEAANNNIRKLSYIEGTLKNCKNDGRAPGQSRSSANGGSRQQAPVRRYLTGRKVA